MSTVSLALVIHSHQPVGNFDHVLEEAYQKSYAPFVQVLLRHPNIRMSLHYSGILLEWIEKHHPEFFDQLRQLLRCAQVELVGGGYFEPILPAIPDLDKVSQLRRLADYIQERFGARPRGAWVAERVWEPTLARPLAEAGVEYTILDDTHFLAAGLDPSQLRGAYITEEDGAPVVLVPSLKSLRYAIPFREPEETLRILREGVNQPSALFAMGDDCEKFGVWPGTFEHCYKNGWLERFFKTLEDAQDWMETTTVSCFLATHPLQGRIYLPTASYAEMMEWALPTATAGDFKACWGEIEHMRHGERFRRFLRGGLWRNFLSKYSEVNQVHKFMIEISRRWQSQSAAKPSHTDSTKLLSQAQTHLLAAQCNDSYWHGVFGGAYAPHLRTAVIRHLIQAESLLDKLEGAARHSGARVRTADFDTDGQKEILVHHHDFAMVLRPADGGTASSLRFKPADAELINSMMRRPEPYHETVRRRVTSPETVREGPASIHKRVLSKEANLDTLIRYDRYARHAFRSYVFHAGKQWTDFNYLRLEENEELAGGPWTYVPQDDPATFEFRHESSFRSNGNDLRLKAVKVLATKASAETWEIGCRLSVSSDPPSPAPLALGLEMVFNLLAPDAPDRYFLANGIPRPLEFGGEMDGPALHLVDEWQRLKISMDAQPQPRWWIAPIETISQSESGFERVYQGSAILAVWEIQPPSWPKITCDLHVEVSRLGP